MTKDQIISEIRRRCRAFGVTFDLRRGSMVELSKGVKCSGYFDAADERGPRLVCAKKLSTQHFLGTLLHEYCHVTQWVENCDIWQKDQFWGIRVDSEKWLRSGKPCTDVMRQAFMVRRDLEADNERRTVRLIKELKAPVNLPQYIQRANSYVHFYNTMPVSNQWYHPEKVPYKMPEIMKLFRDDKIYDNFNKISKRQFKALLSCADHPRS